jgi:hypothetical protein
MQGVSSRAAAVALLVLMLATSAFAGGNGAGPSLSAQFEAWISARIGVPIGATATDGTLTLEDWLILMARIGIPIG